MEKKKVVVGMSGGVDSSVSAYLLKQQGYDVTGLFMKNWPEKDPSGSCLAEKDYEDVARVADAIGIPYYSVDFSNEYREMVFSEFLADLKKGLTPNPDVLCNQKIKFHVFWQKAQSLGAEKLATGHYCQTNALGELLKGKDPLKDQSYFLHAVPSSVLENTLFPIGHLEKSAVRSIAQSIGLSVHEKKDSTGICFIGKRDFRSFVSSYLGYRPGDIITEKGVVIGIHLGAAFYTIGQRKGLGIGGQGDAWFVIGKDIEKNHVIVGQGENHPKLFTSFVEAFPLFWVHKKPVFPGNFQAKIRYRQQEEPCYAKLTEKGTLFVTFEKPQRAATPGQSIVLYQGAVCLGGGKIL